MGQCNKAESVAGEPEERDTLAYAVDSEGWHAWLYTHASFGCVQWASRGD